MRDLLDEGHLGEDQIAIPVALTSVPLTGCRAVEDNATVAACLADNPAHSHVVSEVAEVDSDPLSLGIKMLIKENKFWLSLDALAPAHRNLQNLDVVWDAVLLVGELGWGVRAIAEVEFAGDAGVALVAVGSWLLISSWLLGHRYGNADVALLLE
ncbi:hypothetical protein Nepgr_006544 [Nepenthes gracilis]|uniref:Uncharacterized protein n=1 Tax=Nepenthes gracilis TaxID=150966 RepID=A0AAD3S5K2_NEPGR|nr:hypothetical protein Nepgr_006544 [Nepenthes gracilis]